LLRMNANPFCLISFWFNAELIVSSDRHLAMPNGQALI